jgi:hypothetical protein
MRVDAQALGKAALQIAAPALLALGVILGLGWLGQWARERLATRVEYQTAFADIDCPAPPDVTKADFLGEVQYLAGLPDRFSVLEPGLPNRLAAAFARHPWVESVERVEVVPPRQLCVRLRFRTPVLRVRPTEGAPVVVDAVGVWLPDRPKDALPEFTADGLPGPKGSRGAVYGQTDVEAAARLAAYCRGLGDHCLLQRLDLGPEGFTLTTMLGRIFWGHAPAAELPGEPSAAVKRERLLRTWPTAGLVLDLRREER